MVLGKCVCVTARFGVLLLLPPELSLGLAPSLESKGQGALLLWGLCPICVTTKTAKIPAPKARREAFFLKEAKKKKKRIKVSS